MTFNAQTASLLTAISPLDGRYAGKVDALREHFSEFGLIRARLKVEIEWLKALAAESHFTEIAAFSPATVAELDALRGIEGFELTDRPSMELLAGCDYVVTENSAMALTGFFAEKPAVLFARIDFHHIAASVPRDGMAAFDPQPKPPFAAYLKWFFRRNAITSWADDAVDRIRVRFRNHGWPM